MQYELCVQRSDLVNCYWLLVVNEKEEGIVELHLPNLVPEGGASIYQSSTASYGCDTHTHTQPVVHNWFIKCRGMYCSVYGKVHIKDPLLLIEKSSLSGGSGFPSKKCVNVTI